MPSAPFAPFRTRRSMRRWGPGAFTLIEMIFTISIIALLVAILAAAFKHISRSGKIHSTHVTLNNLLAMYAALEAEAGPTIITQVNQIYVPNWTSANAAPTVSAPTDVSLDAWNAYPSLSQRYGTFSGSTNSPAVNYTQQVMALIRRIPANQSSLAGLPTDQFLADPNVTNTTVPWSPPVLLDGWGNPIIFVPSGGMTGVWLSGFSTTTTIQAPDLRPFWSSAGPDGKFTGYPTNPSMNEGDDNIYSFNAN